MAHPDKYELHLGEQAQAHWEKLADDGTPAQIQAYNDALKHVAENPYTGDPVVTDPAKKRFFVPKLYEGKISDAYAFDDSMITGDSADESMVFEFSNGYEIELNNPRLALRPKYKKNFVKNGLKMGDTFVGGQIKDVRIGSLDQVFLRLQRARQTITVVANEWNLVVPYLDLVLSTPRKG